MNITLHIGSHKTGSTALQKFFYENTDHLISKKILYPRSWLNSYGHHELAQILRTPDSSSIIDEFDSLSENKDYKNILISSENLEDLNLGEVEKLSFLKKSHTLEIVFFYREFCSSAYSVWQESIKHGSYKTFTHFLSEFYKKPFANNYTNPSKTLDNYASVFGKSAIKIIDYGTIKCTPTDNLKKNNITNTFMSLVYNIKSPNNEVPQINKALDTIDIEIIRALNWKAIQDGYITNHNIRESYLCLLKKNKISNLRSSFKPIIQEITLSSKDFPIHSARKLIIDKYSDRFVSKHDSFDSEITNKIKFTDTTSWFEPGNLEILGELYEEIKRSAYNLALQRESPSHTLTKNSRILNSGREVSPG